MDATCGADEERAQHTTGEHGYVEVRKPTDEPASVVARTVISSGAGSSPAATSIPEARSRPRQSSRAQLEQDMETSEQFRQEALRSRRFADAARYHMMIWKSRQSLSEQRPFSIHEKLDMYTQHADILLECDELHIDLFPRDTLELELEQNAHHFDPRKWGELCARMGLLYMRWTALQDLDKAKRYLQIALSSLAQLDPSSDLLLPLSQDLADAYNLRGDLVEAREYFKGDATVDIDRIDRARSWCESRGFNTGRYDAQDQDLGISPLHLAVKQHDADILQVMLDFTRRTVPRDAMTSIASDLLLFAAAVGNAHGAALLINVGASVDAVDPQGRSVLHRCQSCPEKGNDGGLKIARLLLGKNTSLINQQDREGKTALIMACEAGHAPMAELLLEHGSDPSVPDMHGKTCLYTACEKGDLNIARALLGAAANRPTAQRLDINARGPGGCTPIIMAVRAASANRKKVSIVRELRRHDADPSIMDHRGNNAFRYVTGLAARDIQEALGEPSTEEHLRGAPLSHTSRTSSRSTSGGAIEQSSTHFLSTGRASAPAAPKRNKMISLWGLAQSGSKVSLAPSFSTHGSSSGFRSIFSRKSSSSRNTAFSDLTQATSAAQSILEAGEGARSCSPSNCDAASIGSHESSPPHPTQPRGPDSPGRITYRSEDETNDSSEGEQGDEAVANTEGPYAQEPCYSSSTSNEDIHTPSGSDAASERPSNEYSESEPPGSALHLELPIRSSPFLIDHHQLSPGARQHANHSSSTGDSLPSGGSDGAKGKGNATNRSSRDPGRPGGRDNARRRAAALRTAQEDGAPADKYFACPFAKHNFFRHRDCTSYCGKRIRDVKQHVRRAHYHPYYCPRCYLVFGSTHERDAHTRVMSCRYRQERNLDGITDEQDERLARQCPSHMNNDHPAQWYYMFGIIFPDQPQPASPYVDFDPYLVCDSLKNFTREHAAQHVIGRAGQLPCWDAQHLSAIVNIVNGIVDDFCNSLQPPSRSIFGPRTPESLGNSAQLNELPIPEDIGNVEPHAVADHFPVPGGHTEAPIPVLYEERELGISPSFLPSGHWEVPSPAPTGQVGMARSRSYRAAADHAPIELSSPSDCTPLSMFNVPDRFGSQQFELPNVGYGPGVGGRAKVDSVPAPDMRSSRNPDACPSPNSPLAAASENIAAAGASPQASFFFNGHESHWYEMQAPYSAHDFDPQADAQATMMYTVPQQTRFTQQRPAHQASPQSIQDDADAWARLTPSDYSN